MSDSEFYLNRKITEERRKEKARIEKEQSKEKLLENFRKKMTQLMIGSLSAYEKKMGELWGHNIDVKSDVQHTLEERWKEARSEILDLGNRLIRNMEEELEQYEIVWMRYRYQLPFLTSEQIQELIKEGKENEQS